MSDNDNVDDGDYAYDGSSPIDEEAKWELPPEDMVVISFHDRERIGQEDEGWQRLGSTFEGDETRNLTPEERFAYEIEIYLGKFKSLDLLDFNAEDRRIIMGKLDTIHWMRYKNSLLYILGYYVARHQLHKEAVDDAVEILSSERRESRAIMNLMKFSVIKYARYWRFILRFD